MAKKGRAGRKIVGTGVDSSGIVTRLKEIDRKKRKKGNKRGRRFTKDVIGQMSIPECISHIEDYVSLCSHVSSQYKAYKRSGHRVSIERLMRLVINLKKNATLARYHLTYLRRDGEAVGFVNITKFKELVAQGEIEEAKKVAKSSGFNYDDYASLKLYTRPLLE